MKKTRLVKFLLSFVLAGLIFLVPQSLSATPYYQESLRLEKLGRYLEAHNVWQQALNHVDQNAFFQRLGWLDYLMGNYAAARLNYMKAIEANRHDQFSALGIVDCYCREKKFEEAKSYGSYLLKIFPQNQTVRHAFSKALYDGGFYADQIFLADQYPADRVLNTTRGWSFWGQGKYSKARKTFVDLLASSENDQEKAALRKALQIVSKEKQYRVGFFYTPIDYGRRLPEKDVKNLALLYSYDRWTHLRFIYGATETEDDSFTEDSFAFGITKLFGRRNSLSFDFMGFSNNDPLTDGGQVYSLQYGRQTSNNVWAFIEADYTNFSVANALQFSPRILWLISPRHSLELKTYLSDFSDNSYFSDNAAAVRLKYSRTISQDWNFSTYIWKGEKRLAYESDKNYSYNTLDEYLSGVGFEVGYILRSFDLRFGYALNRLRPYGQAGARTNAGQWTIGVTYKD